jgi:hypothetical protein
MSFQVVNAATHALWMVHVFRIIFMGFRAVTAYRIKQAAVELTSNLDEVGALPPLRSHGSPLERTSVEEESPVLQVLILQQDKRHRKADAAVVGTAVTAPNSATTSGSTRSCSDNQSGRDRSMSRSMSSNNSETDRSTRRVRQQ